MSRKQLSRTLENFPQMKNRAKGRLRWAAEGGAALGMSNPNRRHGETRTNAASEAPNVAN